MSQLLDRLRSETPVFWRNVRKQALFLLGLLTPAYAVPLSHPKLTLVKDAMVMAAQGVLFGIILAATFTCISSTEPAPDEQA